MTALIITMMVICAALAAYGLKWAWIGIKYVSRIRNEAFVAQFDEPKVTTWDWKATALDCGDNWDLCPSCQHDPEPDPDCFLCKGRGTVYIKDHGRR